MSAGQERVTFPPSSVVDFVVVGSGAAGGIMAKELSTKGFSVVVLEQGPRLSPTDFAHDEFKYIQQNALCNSEPVSWRQTPAEKAEVGAGVVQYARIVGGSSVHMTANFWRFRPIDFHEASKLGTISGTALADWPISYEDLEPYYTKVDWEIGVSGAPGPGDPPRSRPYPMPPLPVKSSGVLFERGARKLGWNPTPAPMAINSTAFNGRPPCQNCGFCMGFGCEYGAKGSSLAAAIPLAEKTGKCEVRPNSYVTRVEADDRGRATGVIYFDEKKQEQRQRARAVVLCANGAETPRLLLNSATPAFPQGLANSSGMVGKHLMMNGGAAVSAIYEHPLNDYKGVQVTRLALDWYDSDPRRGFYGGGGLDGRIDANYPIFFAESNLPPGVPRWGAEFKRFVAHGFSRQMTVLAHSTSLPVADNSITLDPTVRDAWGMPILRVTYRDHDDDLKMMHFLQARAVELHEAAGAQQQWSIPVVVQNWAVHLLGTCRMGNDARTSVIDKYHRTHDVKNLFLCDGSSFVTSGRGQPTMTIMALAFRAGEKIADFAQRNEI
ncbi:MAG: GMC family oxidoreductase [Gemmatimonadaceae bacterium]